DLADLNGILVIDKPAGMTSHDVVGRIRRMVGMKRVGHGGTLDPFATGLLVIAVGRATRMLQHVQDSDKGYRAHVVLGASTDTADVDGVLLTSSSRDEWPAVDDLRSVLGAFVGRIDQTPPAFSAIKIGGRKLYEMARAGEPIDVPTRAVTIHAIDIVSYDPPDLFLDIHCGKGTYVRALARDIGERLGTAAYCHALRRTNSGRFCLADAWTLDELAAIDIREQWPAVALHPDASLASLPAVVLGRHDRLEWYHGRPASIVRPTDAPHGVVRAYGDDGRFLGIGNWSEATLKPTLVIPQAGEDKDEES
ncbi:MAG: tRNA pseudouridine(55) synthase TruB, partial [Vicinamibacterales bacterium]